MPLEPKLRSNLLGLLNRYHEHVGGAVSTISARMSGDARFFDKLANGEALFSVHRYDRVVAMFSENWPSDLPWPAGVDRISLSDIQERPRAPRQRRGRAAAEASAGA